MALTYNHSSLDAAKRLIKNFKWVARVKGDHEDISFRVIKLYSDLYYVTGNYLFDWEYCSGRAYHREVFNNYDNHTKKDFDRMLEAVKLNIISKLSIMSSILEEEK